MNFERDEITSTITKGIEDAFNMRGDAISFTETTQLFEEGVIDSTGLLEVIALIEETYEFEIPDEDMANSFFSVKSIVDYIIFRLKDRTKCA